MKWRAVAATALLALACGHVLAADQQPNVTAELTQIFQCMSEGGTASKLAGYRDKATAKPEAIEMYMKEIKARNDAEREPFRPMVTRMGEFVYAYPELSREHLMWQSYILCRMEKAGTASAEKKARLQEEGKKCPADDVQLCYDRIFSRL